jgi:hypothetical protein
MQRFEQDLLQTQATIFLRGRHGQHTIKFTLQITDEQIEGFMPSLGKVGAPSSHPCCRLTLKIENVSVLVANNEISGTRCWRHESSMQL